jgi:hypothetical protein
MIALDRIVAGDTIVAVGTLMLTFTDFESSSLIVSGLETCVSEADRVLLSDPDGRGHMYKDGTRVQGDFDSRDGGGGSIEAGGRRRLIDINKQHLFRALDCSESTTIWLIFNRMSSPEGSSAFKVSRGFVIRDKLMKPGHAIRNLARTRLGDWRKTSTTCPGSHYITATAIELAFLQQYSKNAFANMLKAAVLVFQGSNTRALVTK